jgi:hypothetical protein
MVSARYVLDRLSSGLFSSRDQKPYAMQLAKSNAATNFLLSRVSYDRSYGSFALRDLKRHGTRR